MATVFTDEGEKDVLDVYLATAGVRVGLFQNNYVPVAGSVLADLTAATFSGYAVGTPVYGAATTVANRANAVAAALNFDHNGGATANTIYGWYVFNTTTSKLLKANTLGTPVVMDTAGNRITVTDTMLGAGTIT